MNQTYIVALVVFTCALITLVSLAYALKHKKFYGAKKVGDVPTQRILFWINVVFRIVIVFLGVFFAWYLIQSDA